MATFSDLDEFFSPGLTLTVLRKEYTLPLPSAEFGLWCRRMSVDAGGFAEASTDVERAAAIAKVKAREETLPHLPGDSPDVTFEEVVLGSAYQAMVDDQVPDPYVQFAAQTGYVWIIAGEEAAAQFWQSGGRPGEAQGPANRAERRESTRKTSTAGASATKPRASGSGTSSRPKSKPSGRAARTPGPTS